MEELDDTKEIEKLKADALRNLKEAFDQINWSCMPFPVRFHEVFELIMEIWGFQRINLEVKLLDEHGLKGSDWKAVLDKFITLPVNLTKAMADLGGENHNLPIEAVLCYGLLTNQIKYDDDGDIVLISEEFTLPSPESPDFRALLFLAGARFHWFFAEDMIELLKEITDNRIPKLFTLVKQFKSSPRTKKFMRRVTRCYLLGLDVECMVMCRSVLEAELEAQIPRDQCIDLLGYRSWFNIADLIEVAERTGVFTGKQAQKAHKIRKSGNNTVHQLKVDKDYPIEEAIHDVLDLIDSLTKDKE